MRIDVEQVGASVTDVDVRELDDAQTEQLRDAWAAHGVLFFRDQDLTPDDHIRFAERFASIDVNKFFKAVDTHPQIATGHSTTTRAIGGLCIASPSLAIR